MHGRWVRLLYALAGQNTTPLTIGSRCAHERTLDWTQSNTLPARMDRERHVMTASSQPDYQSYTLRLWRLGETGGWRATLYTPQTGRRYTFATVEQLCAFLQAVTSATDEHEANPAAIHPPSNYKR